MTIPTKQTTVERIKVSGKLTYKALKEKIVFICNYLHANVFGIIQNGISNESMYVFGRIQNVISDEV